MKFISLCSISLRVLSLVRKFCMTDKIKILHKMFFFWFSFVVAVVAANRGGQTIHYLYGTRHNGCKLFSIWLWSLIAKMHLERHSFQSSDFDMSRKQNSIDSIVSSAIFNIITLVIIATTCIQLMCGYILWFDCV